MSPRQRGPILNYRPQKKTKELLHHVQGVLNVFRDLLPLTIRQILYRLHSDLVGPGVAKRNPFRG